jgi:Domain of unknown function (DUF4430)
VKRLLLALAVAGLVGCGGEDGGKVTLWVTRDLGRQVLLQEEVPSGLTAMQALDRVADVDTRYGGRFVEGIDSVEGSLSDQRDWFYFINGYEADRSAAEYRLHDGDVEWWDYRSWATAAGGPLVVVGAYPEPFLHGYGGRRRRTYVVGPAPPAVVERLHARVVNGDASIPRDANVLACGAKRTEARFRFAGGGAGDPVLVTANCAALAERPQALRFRYALP